MTQRFQNTIERSARVSGVGFWTGQEVTVEFRPAAESTGVVFVRRDLPGTPSIPADIRFQVPTARRTTLQIGDARVEMVEHVIAALAGLQIDNCEVCVDAPEMPGCDGSAIEFVQALNFAGRRTQNGLRSQLVVTKAVRVEQGDSWIQVEPSAGEFRLTYHLDYPQLPAIGRQTWDQVLSPSMFCDQLARARTFILEHEAQLLRQQGLASHVTYNDLLVFNDGGPIGNELRYTDECVRHKALDVIGDLALLACDIAGHVTGYRCGHKLNAELVRKLWTVPKVQKSDRRTA